MAMPVNSSSSSSEKSGGVIGAIATVHAPMIELTRPKGGEGGAIYDGFDQLSDWCQDLSPDLIVLFSTEHIVNFQRSHVPSFCVGMGECHSIVQEFGLPAHRKIPGEPEAARSLIDYCYRNGLDVSHSAHLALDHGSVIPIHHLDPNYEIPVLPIFLNSIFKPLPTLRRCYQLGEQVGAFVRRHLGDRRVLVIASGGIVHAVGERPRVLDYAFDERFVHAMCSGDIDAIMEMEQEEIDALGNGTNEIRCWLALQAVLGRDVLGEIVTAEPGAGPMMGMYQMKWEMEN